MWITLIFLPFESQALMRGNERIATQRIACGPQSRTRCHHVNDEWNKQKTQTKSDPSHQYEVEWPLRVVISLSFPSPTKTNWQPPVCELCLYKTKSQRWGGFRLSRWRLFWATPILRIMFIKIESQSWGCASRWKSRFSGKLGPTIVSWRSYVS